ncbi:MAG: hypothetical protein F4Z01_04880 [Gammaproteobacteria bacterium]|nr:hypothetical protein [Gammaproteobacteria bacterium]
MSAQPSTKFKQISLVGISLGSGLVLGMLAVVAIQNFNPPNNRTDYDFIQSDLQQDSIKNGDYDSSDNPVVVEKFEGIFKQRSTAEQYKVLYNTLSQSNEQELKEWWKQSKNVERASHRNIAQHVILHNLTAINPQQALRYVDEVSIFQSNALLTTVFSEWAVSHLEDAVKAAASLVDSRRIVALQAILESRDDLSASELRSIAMELEGEEILLKLTSDQLAAQSIEEPAKSWNIMLDDDVDNSLQKESFAKIAEAWREKDGFAVLSHIYTDLPNMRFELVRAIARVDLAGALDFTRTILDENEQKYIAMVIVNEWTRTDAQAALAAALTYTPASMASYLENSVASTWSYTNPNELIENIGSISEELRLGKLESAFWQIARKNPMEAIAKVNSVESYVGNTSSILDTIVFQWSYQEPAVAAEWVIKNFAKDDPQRHDLLENIMPRWARQDPVQAFELAIAQPARSEGIELDYWVIDEITSDGDVELAKKLLPRVKEKTRLHAYIKVGAAMIAESQTEEALELGKDFEDDQRRQYYQRVLNDWARNNPKNLFETLESLPSSSVQSLAAIQLVRVNRYQPLLTDEQIERVRVYINPEDEASDGSSGILFGN